MFGTFHFLRPWWFIALIPAIILFIQFLKKYKLRHNIWENYCDPHLLPHLIVKKGEKNARFIPILLLISWLISICALAGPTWSLYAQPVYQKNIARVIALDVSQSMNTNDLKPSRLTRAKYKTLDLLKEIHEGQTGMLVFSSQAFVVSPLTSDSNTIASMVPILDSSIVPVQGSNILKALQKAADLLNQAGYSQGQIILITDSTPSNETNNYAAQLAAKGYKVSVLAIGTDKGGPISDPKGGFVTDNKGNIEFANLDISALNKLANFGEGKFIRFTDDNSDINEILKNNDMQNLNENTPSKTMETKSLWKDEGHWLIWLLIIITAFMARKGWLEKIC